MKYKLRTIKNYITRLNNSELYELKKSVDHEIQLSEEAIKEGTEKRK